MATPIVRALVYGTVGWSVDRAFTTLTRSVRRGSLTRPGGGAELIPVYALALPLFEPVHSSLRRSLPLVRAVTYGIGFVTAEYAIGRILTEVSGRAPWDYSGSRWSVHGHTRLDYIPLWAVAGLALERIHDRLTDRGRRGRSAPAIIVTA